MQTNATVGIVTLSAPWPADLARLSPAAARAVRSSIAWSGNGSSTGAVTFAAPAAEWRRLLAASEARATLETPDASAY
jgi:RecA-family ATPase